MGLLAAAAPALGIASSILGARKQKKAIARARREQQAAERAAQARFQPYAQAGEYGTQQIQEGLSTGTLGGSFVPTDLAGDPGYQFRLSQAEQAQDRLAAARGGLFSGRAIKAREELAQGLAAQEYDDAYQRWLQEQQNRYGMLSGQQQLGYGAAGGMADVDLLGGERAAQATMARREAQDRGISSALGFGQSLLPGASRTPYVSY